jgi:dihydrofolate reductase
MILSIIVAYDHNQGIGINNMLPWKLSDDLKNFKQETLNKPIIMGRKTFESIGKALPGRRNIILSRQNISFKNCEVFSNVKLALESVKHENEVMIIGGDNIYKQLVPFADKLYITQVNANVKADAFFPTWDKKIFKSISNRKFNKSDRNQYDFEAQIWEKI